MNKNTLNIISVCIVSLIVVFSINKKTKTGSLNSDNIVVDEKGKILTKADQYQQNILETISDENIKKFKDFAKTFEKSSTDNVTDSLSKDIFSQYIKYNTSGEIKEQDILSATQEVLKKDTSINNPVDYSDIKILNSTIANLKRYGNDLMIIQNGMNSGIESLSKKTNKTPYIASIYMKVADILTVTEVPESLVENHINLINGFKKYSEGLTMVDDQINDPAKSLLGVKKLKEATDEILLSLDKIKKTIDLNKIVYASNEPGYLLNK